MSRLTHKYDVPRMVFTALFYALVVLVAGGLFRLGWDVVGGWGSMSGAG